MDPAEKLNTVWVNTALMPYAGRWRACERAFDHFLENGGWADGNHPCDGCPYRQKGNWSRPSAAGTDIDREACLENIRVMGNRVAGNICNDNELMDVIDRFIKKREREKQK